MKDPGAPLVQETNHSRPGRHQWRADFRWAAAWAGTFAGIYSLIVLIETVLRRSTDWPSYHTTTWRILAGYWGGAAVFAVILTVLRPWLGRRGVAALAGFLGGAAVYGLGGLVTSKGLELGDVLATAIIGGVMGLGMGVVFYDDDHNERMSEAREGRRIAFIITGATVLIFLTWAMTYPPLCWLGGKYCK